MERGRVRSQNFSSTSQAILRESIVRLHGFQFPSKAVQGMNQMFTKYFTIAFWPLITLLGAIGVSGKAANPALPYRELDASYSGLRQQFNQDVGHVRILMLLSPT